MGRVQGSSAQPAEKLLRSNVVELRPSQFSLRLRERVISKSDIIIIIIIIVIIINVHTFKIFSRLPCVVKNATLASVDAFCSVLLIFSLQPDMTFERMRNPPKPMVIPNSCLMYTPASTRLIQALQPNVFLSPEQDFCISQTFS